MTADKWIEFQNLLTFWSIVIEPEAPLALRSVIQAFILYDKIGSQLTLYMTLYKINAFYLVMTLRPSRRAAIRYEYVVST